MAQLKYSAASLGGRGSSSVAPTPHSGHISHGTGERSSFGAKSGGTSGESPSAGDTSPVTTPTEAGRSVDASAGGRSVSSATAKNEGAVSAAPVARVQTDTSVATSTRDTATSSDPSSRVAPPEFSSADPTNRHVDVDAASAPMTRLGPPDGSPRPSVPPADPTSSLPIPPDRANFPEPTKEL
jgi:hypothetical protein